MSDSNRTEILNFRVTKDEKRMIEDKAFIKYDTLAHYLVYILHQRLSS